MWDDSQTRWSLLADKPREKANVSWGISFLDKSTGGILNTDIWLLGAGTGVGKTQLCTKIALHNVIQGKKVHFIALEAYQSEIEERIAYNLFANYYYSDPDDRTKDGLRKDMTLKTTLTQRDWKTGKYDELFKRYEERVKEDFEKVKNLYTFYKGDKFDVKRLYTTILEISGETDLIILDHIHYFDYEERDDNKALKEITKAIRHLNQVIQKPMIIVGHLRKRDRFNQDIVPGLDEFHGSSDITKICTGVLTLAKGETTANRTDTYIRISKCRDNGDLSGYLGLMSFNSTRGEYEDNLTIGKLSTDRTKFCPLRREEIPKWMR